MTTHATFPRGEPLAVQIAWTRHHRKLARSRQLAWGKRYASLTSQLRHLRRVEAEEEANLQEAAID